MTTSLEMYPFEMRLTKFVSDLSFEQIPASAVKTIKQMLVADLGCAIAGAKEEGCGRLRRMLVERGGRPEATVLIFGDKLPAPSAALINGVMCRALDFCDAMAPGLHMGSSLIPAVLAAAQISGGCTGEQLLTALAAGAEVGSRLNLTEATYDGFDPTGIAGVFAAAAGAAKVMDLSRQQIHHTLGLAFKPVRRQFPEQCGWLPGCSPDSRLGGRIRCELYPAGKRRAERTGRFFKRRIWIPASVRPGQNFGGINAERPGGPVSIGEFNV